MAALGPKASSALAELRAAVKSESPDVRIAAAEALANLGHDDEALVVLRAGLKHESEFIRLAALNVLDRMGSRARPALDDIRAADFPDAKVNASHAADSVRRMVKYLPGRIAKRAPGE